MADENPMGQGPAVPPQAAEDAKRGATHARKGAEDLRSAAGTIADEYRGPAGKKYGMMLSIVSAVFRTITSNMYAQTQRRRSLPHLGLVSCWV
jgi:hypothetical protein